MNVSIADQLQAEADDRSDVLWLMFSSLTKKGFTRAEALALVRDFQAEMIRKGSSTSEGSD